MRKARRTTRVLLLLLTAAAATLALGEVASAFTVYTLDGGRSVVKWNSTPVSWEVNGTFVPYLSDDVSTIQTAFALWTQPSCTTLTETYEGTTSGQANLFSGDGTDGNNRVVYVEGNRWPVSSNGALAVTQTQYVGGSGGWRIQEADIAFNGGVTWSTNPGSREFDLLSVATHEVGHLYGLQHSDLSDATMRPSTPPGDVTQQDLSQDDINAICYLYPAGSWTCETARTDCPEVQSTNEFGQEVTYGRMGCSGGACSFGGDPGPGQGQGESCGNTQDCESALICVSLGDESFCTAECNTRSDPSCPGGYACTGFSGASDGSGACVPGGGSDDGGDVGDACDSSSQCSSGLCVGTGSGGVCTEYCSTSGQDCGAGFICVPLRDSPEDQGACLADAGTQAPGTECDFLTDCPGGLCLQGGDSMFRCRAPCGSGGSCSSGTACLPTQLGDACFESGDTPLGGACGSFWECRDLACLDGGAGSVCTITCDERGCPGGFSCEATESVDACFEAGGEPSNNDPDPANNDPDPANNDPGPSNNDASNNDGGFVDDDNGGDAFVDDDPFLDDDEGGGGGSSARASCAQVGVGGEAPVAPAAIVALVLIALGVRRR